MSRRTCRYSTDSTNIYIIPLAIILSKTLVYLIMKSIKLKIDERLYILSKMMDSYKWLAMIR